MFYKTGGKPMAATLDEQGCRSDNTSGILFRSSPEKDFKNISPLCPRDKHHKQNSSKSGATSQLNQ